MSCAHSSSHTQSGFGVRGGTSRCFSFWQEFRKCYVTSESPSDCSLQRDDYLECLHHTKEVCIVQC